MFAITAVGFNPFQGYNFQKNKQLNTSGILQPSFQTDQFVFSAPGKAMPHFSGKPGTKEEKIMNYIQEEYLNKKVAIPAKGLGKWREELKKKGIEVTNSTISNAFKKLQKKGVEVPRCEAAGGFKGYGDGLKAFHEALKNGEKKQKKMFANPVGKLSSSSASQFLVFDSDFKEQKLSSSNSSSNSFSSKLTNETDDSNNDFTDSIFNTLTSSSETVDPFGSWDFSDELYQASNIIKNK